MRRALLGSLICVTLLAAAPAIAGDVPPQAAGADTTTRVDPGKKPVKATKTPAAPLSAAAAYEATRTDLPTAPLHARTAAPAASDTPWTGFHVGVSAGMAR